ncbi:glycosyltransferase family 2 protein [Corynebacterium sp. TAE3-ERU12]|uniref:glycosyltransferase family 2 protein n=1 Tax=Corynebacterium sp. TAE3-ERU12 TaxID=2849491 RepID=UPI001C46BF4E|nr:glycosyltransferase family 2 protein [Corynebacterium sp. TAE3-ERU12]
MTDSPTARSGISVIIPSVNEAENLEQLLPRIPAEHDIIIVEGSDIDHTRSVVGTRWPHARVICQTRRGKGNALLCGCAAATGEYLVMLDADGSADPDEIPSFIEPLRNGADLAKGSRYLHAGGSKDLTVLRSLGNRGFTLLTNILFGTSFTDLCYGYNAFTKEMVPRFELPDPGSRGQEEWGDGFEIETLFACRAATAGARIVEVASYEHDRIHGTSNLHAWRDGKRVLRSIIYEWLTHHGRRLRTLARSVRPRPLVWGPPPPEQPDV